MATLKELQATLIETLTFFDKFCKEHNLKYLIDGGTLLGAVRHQGFIPWDDDIDLFMSLSEFRKLEKCFQSDKFFLQTPKTEPQDPYTMYKIRMNNTEMKEDIFASLPIHHGVWIDIFTYTNAGKGKIARKLQVFFQNVLITYRCKYYHASLNPPRRFYRLLTKIPKGFALKIDQMLLGIICLLGSKRSDSYYAIDVCKREIRFWKKQLMDETSDYKFETGSFPGSKDYDSFLKQIYGNDYMTPKQWAHFSDYSAVILDHNSSSENLDI